MRSLLDGLYGAARVAACLSIVSILLLVVAQMASRVVHLSLAGIDEFAGYMMLATVFLSLAPAFRAGSHIRVILLLQALPPRLAWLCELWSLLAGLGLTGYFAYWSVNFVLESYEIREVGHGMVATPLWIPQTSMAVGLIILVVALLDELVATLASSPASVLAKQTAGQAVETGEV